MATPMHDRPLPPHRRHLRPWEAVRGVLLADAVFLGGAAILGFATAGPGGLIFPAVLAVVVASASVIAAPIAIMLASRMRTVRHDAAHLAVQWLAGALISAGTTWAAFAIAGSASFGEGLPVLLAAVGVCSGIAATIGWSWSAWLAGRKDLRETRAT